MLYQKPFPTGVQEFKSHPLYVLKRHLLKFQDIYPRDAEPLGKIRNEEIFSRQNCVTLHSRQTWLKYARTVKNDEIAYKIVKGRLKMSEYKLGMRNNPDLELFGFWQTQPFIPPIAVDGKVPRNDYGNVELFQKSMLPVGCVHLELANLNKVCKKLNIDCAPAVVGFDAHGGFSHAVYNGWVICEEFRDLVVDAHREEERQNELKQIEKAQEKIWGNWRKLIRGLLIREKLRKKYDTNHEAPIDNGMPLKHISKARTSKDSNDDSVNATSVEQNNEAENDNNKPKIDMSILKKPKAAIKRNKKALAGFYMGEEDSRDSKGSRSSKDSKIETIAEEIDGNLIIKDRPKRNTRSKKTIVENDDDNDSEDEPKAKNKRNTKAKTANTKKASKRKSTANEADENDDFIPSDEQHQNESDNEEMEEDDYYSEYFPDKAKKRRSATKKTISKENDDSTSNSNSNSTNPLATTTTVPPTQNYHQQQQDLFQLSEDEL